MRHNVILLLSLVKSWFNFERCASYWSEEELVRLKENICFCTIRFSDLHIFLTGELHSGIIKSRLQLAPNLLHLSSP